MSLDTVNVSGQSYSPLFGHYFLTLQKFLASIKTTKRNENGEFIEMTPTVIMGSPQAAYRRIFSIDSGVSESNPRSINKQPNLPTINFIAMDFRRIFSQENPYARVSYGLTLDKKANFIDTALQTWEISYQVSVWTESYRSRDDLISRIFTSFRGGEIGLKYYPNLLEDPNNFFWFTYRIDEMFQDETQMEELPEKDSRKLIKTTFIIKGESHLSYETSVVPTILDIEILNKEMEVLNKVERYSLEEIGGEEVVVLNNTHIGPSAFEI
jgi:hypothetical protein